MKKAISVLLALLVLALPMGIVSVCADDEEGPLTTVYYVRLPEETKQFTVEPLEGYGTYDGTGVYVPAGGSFKFRVIPKEGYSVQMLQVSYYDTENERNTTVPLEPMKAPDTFTIDSVNADTTVAVNYVMKKQQATLFRGLYEFLRDILNFLARIFGGEI